MVGHDPGASPFRGTSTSSSRSEPGLCRGSARHDDVEGADAVPGDEQQTRVVERVDIAHLARGERSQGLSQLGTWAASAFHRADHGSRAQKDHRSTRPSGHPKTCGHSDRPRSIPQAGVHRRPSAPPWTIPYALSREPPSRRAVSSRRREQGARARCSPASAPARRRACRRGRGSASM